MAKRRNAKKEKAIRNKINARKYRKQSSRYGKRGGRRFNYNRNESNESTEQKPADSKTEKSQSSEAS